MRFPAARDVDQRQYQARLDFLAEDTAHLAVPLLRAACDRVARDAKGLPYASEIIRAAADLVEERQRIKAAAERQAWQGTASAPQTNDRVAAFARANQQHLAAGGRLMCADDGSTFMLGGEGERRGVRADGSAIVPFFHKNAGPGDGIPSGWYVRQDDAAAMADCYRRHGARFVMRGAMIVEAA